MFYYLFELLRDFDIPGARLMTYITFRSGVALVLSLFIAIVIGRKIIDRLQKMQVGEIVRDLNLEGQMSKQGTPTMGGIIIIIAIVVPCLLVGKLSNVYMLLMLFSTIWLGCLGFADDYLKLARHNKDGLKGKFKIVGQVGLGLVVGLTMYLSPNIVMRENIEVENRTSHEIVIKHKSETIKAPQTTIPFVKNNNFDYTSLTRWMGKHAQTGGWILFILVTIIVVTEQRSKPHRRPRRLMHGHLGGDRSGAGYNVLSGRQRHLLQLPQHYVYPRQFGTGGVCCRFHRCHHRIPVV